MMLAIFVLKRNQILLKKTRDIAKEGRTPPDNLPESRSTKAKTKKPKLSYYKIYYCIN